MKLPELQYWIDDSSRSGPEQMAVDEAAFLFTLETGAALLRFYQWSRDAVTIGYFDDFPAGESRPVIRRMTGGGLVEHGSDVTFCLTLPPASESAKSTTESRYRWIHEALGSALDGAGSRTILGGEGSKTRGPCFSNPVKWDLLGENGQKIAGGAQRKSRGTVIHQGSVHLHSGSGFRIGEVGWIKPFALELASQVWPVSQAAAHGIEKNASFLAANKYGTSAWNQNSKIIAR